MRSAAWIAVLSLCCAACGVAGSAQPQPQALQVDKAVSLRAGESAQTADGAVRIGFEGVTADSRCPKGEQCVWAGDATVRIWLQRASGPREVRELHSASGVAEQTSQPSPGVRLVRLDPAPVTGTALRDRDYTATLILTRGPAPDATR